MADYTAFRPARTQGGRRGPGRHESEWEMASLTLSVHWLDGLGSALAITVAAAALRRARAHGGAWRRADSWLAGAALTAGIAGLAASLIPGLVESVSAVTSGDR
jgi:hypothetical protein